MDQLVVTPLRTFHMRKTTASSITGFDDFQYALSFLDDRMTYNFQLPKWIIPSSELPVRYGNVNHDTRLWESFRGLRWSFTPAHKF
jgi:hypothetical protein